MSQDLASHVQERCSQVLQCKDYEESDDTAAEFFSTEYTPLLEEENKDGKSSLRPKTNYFKGSWMDMFTLARAGQKLDRPKPIDKDHRIALLQTTIVRLDTTHHKAMQQQAERYNNQIATLQTTIQQLNANHLAAVQQAEEASAKLQTQLEVNSNLQQTNGLMQQRLAALTETNQGLVHTDLVLRELVQSERSARQDSAKHAENYRVMWQDTVKELKQARKEPARQTLTLSETTTTINYSN